MSYLVQHFWVWLSLIFATGLITALLVDARESRRAISPWLIWLTLAFLVGLALAALRVMIGRYDIWLETALASFALFIIGAGAGALLRGGALREHKAWALGLIPASLIWFGANLFATPEIEADLRGKAVAAVEAAGDDAHAIEVSGRDLMLRAEGDDHGSLTATLAAIPGVRMVLEATGANFPVLREKTQVVATAPGPAQSASSAPTPLAVAPAAKPEEKQTVSRSSRGAQADRTRAARATLSELPKAGSLDGARCQAALSAVLALETIEFRSGSATIHRGSAAALDRIAYFLNRCPAVKAEVGGHTDNVGGEETNVDLSRRRAQAVANYLEREGVGAGRLTAVGYGASRPLAPNDNDEGRAQNRRIEIVIK